MAIPILAGILGVMAIWNLLTDPVWIGDSLNVLPKGQREDIQKRGYEIGNLLKNAKDIIYAAKNQKRSITSAEKELLRKNALLAEEKIAALKKSYEGKFALYGRKDVQDELDGAVNNLLLQVEDFKAIAGLLPRPAITKTEIEDTVITVFDGDTVKLQGGETVRLVGIDAPESTTDAGVISKKYLKQRLEGKKVVVASDPNALKDMYGRRLGIILLNGENINIEMLKMGLADTSFFEPNALVFEKQWKAAATEAKQKKKAAPADRAVAPYVYGGVVKTAPIGAAREEDINIATQQVQNFLSNLPARLDFEITTKFNPIDANGKMMEGRHQIAHVYLFSGPYKKTKITELILRKMAEGEKPLSKSEEDPVEEAMRSSAKGTPIAVAQAAAITTAPIISATIAKNYYRYQGENDVFEKGTDRYITFEEATQKNIWDQVEVMPRPVVIAAVKEKIEGTLYENKEKLIAAAAGLPETIERLQQYGPAATTRPGMVESTFQTIDLIKKYQSKTLKVEDLQKFPAGNINTNVFMPGGVYWQPLLQMETVGRRYWMSAKKMPITEANKILQTEGFDALNKKQQEYELR